jgi:glucosamine--fructose-6-phosphate aminotransferase (isomerizing)
LASVAHGTIFTNAGPEIGVCSTKAFTSQIFTGAMLVYELGQILGRPLSKNFLNSLLHVPAQISLSLQCHDQIKTLAKRLVTKKTFMFIGRGINYPIALEGALKLKEVAYVHAEGHAAGELKHGHIALIDEQVVAIGIAPKDNLSEKTISNMMEIKARGGEVIGIGFNDDTRLAAVCSEIISIPKLHEDFQPICSVIPLQLFSFEIAKLMNRDIDQPRNLAKSVTVE